MPSERITNVSFPTTGAADTSYKEIAELLHHSAAHCLRLLVKSGLLSSNDAESCLEEYTQTLSPDSPSSEFIAFLATRLAHESSDTMEQEIGRIQKCLREQLGSVPHYWNFGHLRNGGAAFFNNHPDLQPICNWLDVSVLANSDFSVLQLASINPLSVLIASAWLKHLISKDPANEVPFIFTFMVDVPTWNSLSSHHFKS